MRKLFASLLLVLALAAAGCCKGHVDADAIDGSVKLLVERHDAMLDGKLDPKSISEEDRKTFKRTGQLVVTALQEAKK